MGQTIYAHCNVTLEFSIRTHILSTPFRMFASSRRVTYQIVLRRREVDAKLISRKKCEHSGMKKEGAHHACAQSEFTKQGIGGRDLRSILGFPYKTSTIFGFFDPLPPFTPKIYLVFVHKFMVFFTPSLLLCRHHKVSIKSPWTVVGLSQIIHCLSDNSSRGQAITRHR